MTRVMAVAAAAAISLIAVGGQSGGVFAPQAVAASQLDLSAGVIVFTKLSEDQNQNEDVVAEIYIMKPDGSNQRVILRSSRERLPTLVTFARLLRQPWTLEVKLTENGWPVRRYVMPATLHPPTILFVKPFALDSSALPCPNGSS